VIGFEGPSTQGEILSEQLLSRDQTLREDNRGCISLTKPGQWRGWNGLPRAAPITRMIARMRQSPEISFPQK
jgi:hypothetical protein